MRMIKIQYGRLILSSSGFILPFSAGKKGQIIQGREWFMTRSCTDVSQ